MIITFFFYYYSVFFIIRRFTVPLDFALSSKPVYCFKFAGRLKAADDNTRSICAAWFAQAQKVINDTHVLHHSWDFIDIKLGMLTCTFGNR